MSLPPLQDQPALLLTGITGGLGAQLLPGLLQAWPQHQVLAPVRAADDQQAALRVAQAAEFAGLDAPSRARLVPFAAQLADARLGLGSGDFDRLLSHVGSVYHLAASVDFDQALDDARRANVDTTAALLGLARQCPARRQGDWRFNHVSTAYVCGRRRGLLRETELDLGQSFWNGYEQSKLESERLVQQAAQELAVTVYRPSQIIGGSADGRLRHHFGFYDFVQLAAADRMPLLLADPGARPDMVPADHVCRALLLASREPGMVGRTLHLAAGVARSLTVREVVDLVVEVLDARDPRARPRPRPPVVTAEQLPSLEGTAAERAYNYSPLKLLMSTYAPYLAYERDFDVGQTAAWLADHGIEPPSMPDALRQSTHWFLDRRPPPRSRQAPAKASTRTEPLP